MPASIYLTGNARSGKTAVALGLALNLKEKGYRVTYFKPQGFQSMPGKREDDDIKLMKKALSLTAAGEVLSPVALNHFYLSSASLESMEESLEKLDRSYQKLSEESNVILMEGSITPFIGKSYGMDDYSLARRWNAAMIQVISADDDFELDRSLCYISFAALNRVTSLGCIFNNVAPEQWETTTTVYRKLVEKSIPWLGALPRREEISTPTVREFFRNLGGEILAGEDHLGRRVENVVIGTMTIESALRYLRRSAHKLVITGGDRSDMALTALETSTSALVLTGGLYPDVKVLSRAEEKKVPVILVHYDTFTAVENLHNVYRSIHPENQEACEMIRKDIETHLELSGVYEYVAKASNGE